MSTWHVLPAPACTACRSASGWRRFTCPDCGQKNLCFRCCDHPLIRVGDNKTAPETISSFDNLSVVGVCRQCRYRTQDAAIAKANGSSDDAHATWIGNRDAKDVAVGFLWIHGGGSNRSMFYDHAQEVHDKLQSIVPTVHCLIDLPGHGTRYNEECNLTACVDAIIAAAKRLAAATEGGRERRLYYAGASLGGYLGMEAMKRPDFVQLFDGAAIVAASQRTGSGDSSVAAQLGLVMMGSVMSTLGKTAAVKAMLSVTRSSKHLSVERTWRTALRDGFFFDKGAGQVSILKASDPLPGVKQFAQAGRRIVFLHGSKDHHDNAVALQREATAASPIAGSIVTEEISEGDHFFTHDTRHFDKVVNAITRLVVRPPES